MSDSDMMQDGGPAAKRSRSDSADVFAAKIVQFKKPSEKGAKVVHGIMEMLEGEFRGMKGFFQTSHGYVWGHHLARANLMYNLRPGDVFLVEATKKTITAVYGTSNDAQDVPLIIKNCWLGIQSEEAQTAAGNVEFSAWLADRDISEYEFKKWINDRLEPVPYFPLPTDAYKGEVVSLIRESPKCEGCVVRITDDGPFWDLLVLVEREELYVCGVSVGASDLRMLVRPGDVINVQVQFMSGKERQAKARNYPKLEDKEINHSALIAYLGKNRPRSSSLQPKDSSELFQFLEAFGITVQEFENMRTPPTEEESTEKGQAGGASSTSGGTGAPSNTNSGAYCLPNILQIPPFSGTAMLTFCPNLPQPSDIPPMGVHELEQLARCSVVISRAIVVNMMKEKAGTTINVGDIIESEDDVESAIKMGRWITEALIQKMQTHLQSKVKTKLGPNFGSILSTQKKQIEAAIKALSTPGPQPGGPGPNMGGGGPPPNMGGGPPPLMGGGPPPNMGGPPPGSGILGSAPPGFNNPGDNSMMDQQQVLEQQRIALQLLEKDKGNKRGSGGGDRRRRTRSPGLDLKEVEEEKRMEPLELLRKYVTLKRRFYISSDNTVVLGEVRFPKDMRINYRISNDYELTGGPKEFYTIECLYFFAKNMDIDHSLYVRRALTDNLAVVRQQDREGLKEYLHSVVKFTPNIENIHLMELNPNIPGACVGGVQRRSNRGGSDHHQKRDGNSLDQNRQDPQLMTRQMDGGGNNQQQPPPQINRPPPGNVDPISAAINIVSQKMSKIDPDQGKWGNNDNLPNNMNNLAQQQMQMANQNMGQQQPSNNSMLEEWKAKNNFNQNQSGGSGRMDDRRGRRRSRSRDRNIQQINRGQQPNPFDHRDGTMMNQNPFSQQSNNQQNNQFNNQNLNQLMGSSSRPNAFDRLGPVPAPNTGMGSNNIGGNMQQQNSGGRW